MGRITASVRIENVADSSKSIRCDALVDTGASHLVLPSAWKDRLGELELIETIQLQTATQDCVSGEIWGPVKIQIEGFRHIYNEVGAIIKAWTRKPKTLKSKSRRPSLSFVIQATGTSPIIKIVQSATAFVTIFGARRPRR